MKYSKLFLSFIAILLFFKKSDAQYFLSIDPKINYTLINRKYVKVGNDLLYKFENGATYSLGISVGYKYDNRHSFSIDLGWSEFDFAKRNKSKMVGGSYSFASYGISGIYIVPTLGLNYVKEWQSWQNNKWQVGAGLALGYYIDDTRFTNDTSNFNTYTWFAYNNLNEIVLVDKIDKGSKWVPLLRLSAGYKVNLGRRFYFSPSIIYQLGFSNFITFQYRLQYKSDPNYTIVENSLRGSNLQLVLKFEYQFKKRDKIQYLVR